MSALVSVGTIDRISNGTLNPGTPSGIVAGYGLYLAMIGFAGTTLTGPGAPWVNDSPNGSALQLKLFRTVAVGGDTIPSVGSGVGYAAAIAFCVSGVDTSFTPVFTIAEKATTSNNTISSPSVTRTPGVNGAFCVILGKRDKTATSNGSVYGNPAGWFSILAAAGLANVDVPAGANVSDFALWYQIQTTATAISPNTGTAGSVADGAANNLQSNVMGYGPAVIAPSALLSWPKQTFVTETLIQY